MVKKRPELLAVAVIVFAYFLWAFAFTPDRNPELGQNPPLPESQYYNLLVQGFTDGHLYLRRDVPAGLAELKNPYDPKENLEFRQGSGYLDEDSIHDLSYYKGRFYLYFSAVPALLLFVPFALLTGTYLDQGMACAIFCSVGFIAQSLCLYKLQKTLGNKVSPLKLAFLFFALGMMNLCPLLLRRAAVWEVPISAGYALESIAIYLTAKIYFARTISPKNILLLGLTIALGIVCRPTLLPLSLMSVVPLWGACRKSFGDFFRALIHLAVPAASVTCAALWYNYSRFGNVLEFGTSYHLSGDPRNLVLFSLHYLPFSLEQYLFVGRRFVSHFPFLATSSPTWFPKGFLGVESPVGLLTCLPAIPLGIFFLVFSPKPKHIKKLSLLIGLVAGANLLLLSSFIGACFRYEIEFSTIFAFLSVLGFLVMPGANQGKCSRFLNSVATLFIIISLIFVLLEINTPLSFYINRAMYI